MAENNPYCFRTEQQLAEGVAQWKSRPDPCEPYFYQIRPKAAMTSVNEIAPDNDSRIVCRWLMSTGQECDEVFNTPATLATHLFEAHFSPDTSHICRWRDCQRNGTAYKAKHLLVAHSRQHSGEKPFTCKACNQAFSRAGNLKLHNRIHTGEKPFKCKFENCGKVFVSSSDQKKHLNVHSTKKCFHCKYAGCNKKYSHPDSLRNHHCVHSADDHYQCKFAGCDKKYKTPYLLRKHHKNDHENGGNTSTTSNNDESSGDSYLSEVESLSKKHDG